MTRVWPSMASVCSISSRLTATASTGQAKSLVACGQRHLGEARCRHRWRGHAPCGRPAMALSRFRCQPATHAHGLKASRRARRARGAHPPAVPSRVSSRSRSFDAATVTAECRSRLNPLVFGVTPRVASWAWTDRVSSSPRFIADVTTQRSPRGPRRKRFADSVGEQRVRADFDERVVSVFLESSRHGLAEPHRVAQVDHPVIGGRMRVRRRWSDRPC